ncbi:PQQ-dependent sugar dehydrogenase [Nocardioides sp.]|uniref:PQQ-dependent sugar dehydrogenase n=1 Tax=Nocardioides sp. TaxID=35761 RepID=UPI003565EBBD
MRPDRWSRLSLRTAALVAAPALAVTGCAPAADGPRSAPPSVSDTSTRTTSSETSSRTATGSPAVRGVPRLRVTTRVRGLDNPWDVKQIGRKRLLISERDSGRLIVWEGGRKRVVDFPSETVWVEGETGLMSLEVDPRFAKNRRIYTCQGGFPAGGGNDVRVMAWRMNAAATRATKIRALVTGLPATTGRHGGCRLEILRNGALLVGTGDAAQGSNPRDLTSLGGKTLRLNRWNGKPLSGNPFSKAADPRKRYVFTYGHRNIQGLAQRRDGSLWSIEHGPWFDDEVNKLRKGGDYGWHPVPGYNEDVPMTDQSLPGRQVEARWSSGEPTLATSGGAWVTGRSWGALRGTLAVAALKAERVVFMTFDTKGRLLRTRTPAALRDIGRLRSITVDSKNRLLITTDLGYDRDKVLLVRPR